MAGQEAPERTPQDRVEHIKEMVGEIGTQQREVMHLVTLTFQALYLFFAFACLTAGVVAEVNGKHSTAVVWGALGIGLAAIWLFVKVLAKSMKKVVRALRDEMARLPDELQREFVRGGGRPVPGGGIRGAAVAGIRGPRALQGLGGQGIGHRRHHVGHHVGQRLGHRLGHPAK